MGMQRKKQIVANVGKYKTKDRNTGETVEKNRYQNCGTLFERDDGSLCIKLDCLPIGCPDWNGWMNFYDFKNFDDKPANQKGLDDDEIPF